MSSLPFQKDINGFSYEGRAFEPLFTTEETITEGSIVPISIKAGLQDNLDFSKALQQAEKVISKQAFIFWELDLGLFKNFASALQDPSSFQALLLACSLVDEKLLQPFSRHSFALCLFKGDLFSPPSSLLGLHDQWLKWLELRYPHRPAFDLDNVPSSQQAFFAFESPLFFQDVYLNYLRSLSASFTTMCPLCLMLDLSSLNSPSKQLMGIHPDHFEGFDLALNNKKLASQTLSLQWESCPISYGTPQLSQGLCLPYFDSLLWEQQELLESALSQLKTSYRLLTEDNLIHQWDSLDTLYVIKSFVTPMCQRKLKGFEAAGGELKWIER